ncbi:prepilin-type N-terminal cleavage/methylation domain-containing protein [Bdellovibrio sp. 22V]|uniref:type IV pilus modification PilV family protein n=1 Tax=Bdellovibrio sp. 22V TaxID=3044166 RepID=UPI0025433DA0|nr:prepilin-type N-terminal cleavage/methylation domain-containing protein [Bdellovibrio sp. 22V]WII71555.1 prepilin-type N-terminal cleavage/methylation domain-containing protein [Bdellovibrio sp. 22V]
MSIKNRSGFSLVESLVGLFILTVSAGIMLSIAKLQFYSQKENVDYASIVSLRESIIATVASQEAWDKTKSLNPGMACSLTFPSTCADNQIREVNIYRSDGSLYVGSSNPRYGFTADGKPCATYGSANSPCQIKARVFWKNVCVATSAQGCRYPSDQLSVLFYSRHESFKKYADAQFRLRRFDVLSMNRHSFGVNNSPVASCLAKGPYIFIGFGKTFNAPSGGVARADADGCVNISFFKGARGDTGPRGPMGPRGPQGPPGPPGVIYTVAGPPSPPPCTAFGCPPAPTPVPTPTPTPTRPPGKWICPGNDQNNPNEWLPYPEDMRLFPSLYSQICGGGLGGGEGGDGGAGGGAGS